MGIQLVICLFLVTQLHAVIVSSSTNSTSTSTTTTDVSLPDNNGRENAISPQDIVTSSSNTTSTSTTTTDVSFPDNNCLNNSISAQAHTSVAPTTMSSARFDMDAEIAKINATCFTPQNYEELSGNIVKSYMAEILSIYLLQRSVITIGLAELRASLRFPPLLPSRHYNRTHPSAAEVASAPTIQAYYDLQEPEKRSIFMADNLFREHTSRNAIVQLDKLMPSIRRAFRGGLAEFRRSNPGEVDRETIDRMIKEYHNIRYKVEDALSKLTRRSHECWEKAEEEAARQPAV